jgi:hypothetical protein
VGLGVAAGVGLGVADGVGVGIGVGLTVGVGTDVGVGTAVGVGLGLTVGVGVGVGVGLGDGTAVGVALGAGARAGAVGVDVTDERAADLSLHWPGGKQPPNFALKRSSFSCDHPGCACPTRFQPPAQGGLPSPRRGVPFTALTSISLESAAFSPLIVTDRPT